MLKFIRSMPVEWGMSAVQCLYFFQERKKMLFFWDDSKQLKVNQDYCKIKCAWLSEGLKTRNWPCVGSFAVHFWFCLIVLNQEKWNFSKCASSGKIFVKEWNLELILCWDKGFSLGTCLSSCVSHHYELLNLHTCMDGGHCLDPRSNRELWGAA